MLFLKESQVEFVPKEFQDSGKIEIVSNHKCKGDTIPCPCLFGSAPKDDTVENRQGQRIMSPKVISGQEFIPNELQDFAKIEAVRFAI
jgi:hypothetical protein